MVSGRQHKVYESEDSPAEQHKKETSTYNFRIKVQSTLPLKFDKKGCLDIAGLPKISKTAIDDLIADVKSGSIEPIEVMYWKGESIAPVDINYKNYIALKRTKRSGVREITVYNPENKKIEVIDYAVHKEVVQQERDK